MIVSGLVLFLFGTTVSAGPFMAPAPTEIVISKNKNSASDNIIEYSPYGPSEGAPFIKNFIQKGTNVFFKPQFMLAAQQMPPQIQEVIAQIEKDDCKTSYPMGPVPVLPIVEEPLRIIEKELTSPIVKEVIEINPLSIAHPKTPVIIEEPCDVPILPTYIPKVEIPAPMVPVVMKVEEPRPHVVVPPAPVLPPLVIPKVPMIVEVERPKEIVMPMIPPAPVLPPMEIPKMPLLIEEPCAPVEVIHEMPQAPVFVPEPFVVEEPLVIPPAPVLPPFVPPVIPEVFVEEKSVVESLPIAPYVDIVEPALPMVIPEAPVLRPYEIPAPVIIEEVVKPAVIPPAPVLPPLEIPKMSVLVEEPSIIPCPPGEEIHEIISKPIVLPEAPVLPPFTMPKLPVEVLVEEKFVPSVPTVEIIQEPIAPMVIPEAPVLPPLAPIEFSVPVILEEPVKPVVLPPTPVLPPLEIPKSTLVAPCESVEIKEEYFRQPVLIPEAPLLPSIAPMRVPAPIIVEEPVRHEVLKPTVLPTAPVLPPLAPFPRAPMVVERPGEVIVAPCPPENEVIIEKKPIMPMPFEYSELSLTKPIVVPTAPMAPEFYVHHNINEESVMVEKRPLLPFPQGCAEDIVVERILPKMEMALRPHAANAPVPIRYAPLGYALI